jgi:hypothetical protein
VHGAHQHAVLQDREAEVERLKQVRIQAHTWHGGLVA